MDAALETSNDKPIHLKSSTLLNSAFCREEGLLNLSCETALFKTVFAGFWNDEYAEESPTKTFIPIAGSLCGDDGSFILLKLTKSELFRDFKSSVDALSALSGQLHETAATIRILAWIQSAVDWIVVMQSSVRCCEPDFMPVHLSLPYLRASELIQKGHAIFLCVSNDVRMFLRRNGIKLSSNSSGNLVVLQENGGVKHSIGAMFLQTCRFIFNALKFDMHQHNAWDQSLTDVSYEYIELQKKLYTVDQPATRRALLQQYLGCRENLIIIRKDLKELIVRPLPTTVYNCRALAIKVECCIQEHFNFSAALVFADSRYTDQYSVTDSRQSLLKALVDRISVRLDSTDFLDPWNLDHSSIRDAGRAILSKSLLACSRRLCVVDDESDTTLKSVCIAKAWSIENAIFDLCQEHPEESGRPDRYLGLTQSLERSLSDQSNALLGVRVLCGKTNAVDLVRMSPEELKRPILQKVGSSSVKTSKDDATSWATANPTKGEQLHPCSNEISKEGTPTTRLELLSTISKIHKDAISSMINVNRSTREVRHAPSPPLSLAVLLKTNHNVPVDTTEEERKPAYCTSGGKRFLVSLAEGTRNFYTSLSIESDPQDEANGLLPETLVQKGRVSGDQFRTFLTNKLTGRWIATVLRLSIRTASDAQEFKKFYREYERNKKRLAMFSFDEFGKGFLVTPMFQQFAEGIAFSKKEATYIVVLTLKK